MDEGLLDTNIFLRAQSADALTAECQAFLTALAQGRVTARLEPLVLHELTYALPRRLKQLRRADVARYLVAVLGWPGVTGAKVTMLDAVRRWAAMPGLAFVDAYLAALAIQRQCPVYTKNVKDLTGQGVDVPNPLPSDLSAS